ncbi:nucleoside kinase [Diplocloster agilis]|uniref:Nucleoside kinase n=1 Tax=Diplocloster agilis TaxID=2850323 RepID=A0A949NGB7_9FIRM|nr:MULTISPECIES: nucleoside kinase [Lachnospiraceae]MBU9738679.1 nucleoside kinase [Diplocloster agilis]MBU9746741.1 nucleoside kinase [Diplocloster agilis]MCU6736255.1 nucleoside kinase [Suonthocola fibrivorans]SCJ88446.1 Uridine kinase [uncultured Clostridium sp.]
MVKITVNGEDREYPAKTPFLDIAREYQSQYEDDILLVMADNRLRELHKQLKDPCELSFITARDSSGMKTYQRSVLLLMIKAVYDVCGHDQVRNVRVNFSLGAGLYCTLEADASLTQDLLDRIKARMRELVERKIPIMKRSVNTDDAIRLFGMHGMYDKERLFRYRMVSKVNIYSINEFEDYYYGYMVNDTGYLKYFDLYLYDEGFVLQLPTRHAPKVVPSSTPHGKLFHVLKESEKWGEMLKIGTVGSLNDRITKGEINDLILVQEALQEHKMSEIGKEICARPEKKFVMIAGPSSSGKTTFAHRLSIQLTAQGLTPHPISIDDYFLNRDQTPLDADGKPNYECLEALDVRQFNQDMNDLLEGRQIELPTFNFKTGKREYRGRTLKLGAEDVLVIEGIHGLNDKLSPTLPRDSKYKIYISALTQLNIDEHNRIPSTDGRLIRRLVRDYRTRGTSADATINMWASVRRGEEENIFPYQEEADVMFNSALIYELAVLKQYAQPILFGIPRESEEYVEAKRLLKFLDYFIGVGTEHIPMNSILREFVGGSCFYV